MEHPWWMDTLEPAFKIFTQGSFSDPPFLVWGVLPFPLSPCPKDMFPFEEIDKKLLEAGFASSYELTPDQNKSHRESSPSSTNPGERGKNEETTRSQRVSTPTPNGHVSPSAS